jgi:hypothetical protein
MGEETMMAISAPDPKVLEDLRRIAAEQVASALDLERCALHAGRHSDPVAWLRRHPERREDSFA